MLIFNADCLELSEVDYFWSKIDTDIAGLI